MNLSSALRRYATPMPHDFEGPWPLQPTSARAGPVVEEVEDDTGPERTHQTYIDHLVQFELTRSASASSGRQHNSREFRSSHRHDVDVSEDHAQEPPMFSTSSGSRVTKLPAERLQHALSSLMKELPQPRRGPASQASRKGDAKGFGKSKPSRQGKGWTGASGAAQKQIEYRQKQMCDAVIQTYCAGDVVNAESMMDSLSMEFKGQSCKVIYHMLINSCSYHRSLPSAVWCVMAMVQRGLQPTIVTFNSVLNVCAKVGNARFANKWWNLITEFGSVPNEISYNIMMNTCAQGQDGAAAESWMVRMMAAGISPCLVSFSTVISAFAKTGEVRKAELWYKRMLEARVNPDRVIFNSLINACAKSARPAKAERWFCEMRERGISPDLKTFNSLIHACAKNGDVHQGEFWLKSMEDSGFIPDKVTYGSIIHACAKHGTIEQSEYWMEQMIQQGLAPNLVCCNIMLHACAQQGHAKRALEWLERLPRFGLSPNRITFNCMIDVFAKAGDIQACEAWLQSMIEHGFHPDEITYTTILRSFTHGDPVAEASEYSVHVFTLIVKAYSNSGDAKRAMHWLKEMLSRGCQPSRALCEEIERLHRSNNFPASGAWMPHGQAASF